MDEKELEFRIGRLTIADGDVLVVKVTGHMTEDMAKSMCSICADRLPKGINYLVIDSKIGDYALDKH